MTSAEMLLISQELKMYLGIFPLLDAGDLTRGVSGPSGTHSDVVRNLWGSHFKCQKGLICCSIILCNIVDQHSHRDQVWKTEIFKSGNQLIMSSSPWSRHFPRHDLAWEHVLWVSIVKEVFTILLWYLRYEILLRQVCQHIHLCRRRHLYHGSKTR